MSVASLPPKKRPAPVAVVAAAVAAQQLERQALVQADRETLLRAADPATNPVDPRMRKLKWTVIADAYDAPKAKSIKYEQGILGEKGKAIEAYFEPGRGPADRLQHDRAVPMADYLAQLLEPRIITAPPNHPVLGHLGVFARVAIPQWTVLGMYGGMLTSSARVVTDHNPTSRCERTGVDADRQCNRYSWVTTLHNSSTHTAFGEPIRQEFQKLFSRGYRNIAKPELEILGLHQGNMLRFVNSYKDIVARAYRNVGMLTVWWKDRPRIVYYTRRAVAKDEELVLDYGKEFPLAQPGAGPVEVADEFGRRDPNELVVDAILKHRPATTPLYFTVKWKNGTTTEEHVSNLVEYDDSDPADPFIFNATFRDYLEAKGIPESLYRKKALYRAQIEAAKKTRPAARAYTEKSDSDSDDSDSGSSEASASASATEPALMAIPSTEFPEMRVVAIRDMEFREATGGYFFDTWWANGQRSWEPAEHFVTRDAPGQSEPIYNDAFVTFLRERGIPDPETILSKRVVAVRIMSHVTIPVQTEGRPDTIVFRVEYSSGDVIGDVRISQLIGLTYDSTGGIEVRFSPPLRDYMDRLEAQGDKETLAYIRARIQTILDAVKIVDDVHI
jgi:hypothetical protein